MIVPSTTATLECPACGDHVEIEISVEVFTGKDADGFPVVWASAMPNEQPMRDHAALKHLELLL